MNKKNLFVILFLFESFLIIYPQNNITFRVNLKQAIIENHFTGNLYTLIDHCCGSTNGHFSALLKYHKIGKFVGVEGSAAYKCNARIEEFQLKNTHLIVNVARQTSIAAIEGMDKTKGVEHDYFVEQPYEDFLNGNDIALEYTLKLIGEH